MTKKGKFIVLEGLDGSGKTTQMKLLAEKMGNCVQTFEPTDGAVGSLIRRVLHKEVTLDNEVTAMLFAADRLQHVRGTLVPAVEAGLNVISDRYYYSNFVYQQEGIGLDRLMELNSAAMETLRPDLTVFLDVPVEECLRRIGQGRESFDLYESREKLTAVRQSYIEVFERLKDKENIVILPADRDERDTLEALWEQVSGILK